MRQLLNRLRAGVMAASCGGLLAIAAGPGHAAENEIRLVRQFGIHYLPLIVMESEKLIEKHAQANGLPAMKVQWATISGGASVNDALLSGAVDFSAGGVGPLIVLWDKSAGGKGDVKGVAAVSDVPMTLTSRNPAIKGIEDFTEKDRIALPAVKTSMQAVTLQMAATKKWGIASYERLDKFTVAMRHPDAAAALMSGKTEINSHFTAAPYDFEELRTPGIHQVLDSYDVYGGPATLIVLYTTKKYMDANPKVAASVVSAMGEAMEMIAKDKQKAARIYLEITKEKTSVDDLVAMLDNPKVAFRLQPSATFPVAEFLHSTGRVKTKAESWKDLFFPIAHSLKGS